jgi:hypothetical protein
MSHALQFIENSINSAGPDEQDAVRQPAGDLQGQLFPRQQFLGQDGVLGQDQADATV